VVRTVRDFSWIQFPLCDTKSGRSSNYFTAASAVSRELSCGWVSRDPAMSYLLSYLQKTVCCLQVLQGII
jgi:hypothetical protein